MVSMLSLRPMRTPFQLLVVLLATDSVAQPVLMHPDAIPALGAYPVETRSYGVVPGLLTMGSDVVWDFSSQGFTVVGTTTDSILAPEATPYASDFPTATIAVRLVNQFGFYHTSSTEVLDLGMRLSAGSPSQINTDPASVVHFPAGVGDTWTDAVATANSDSELQVTILAEGTILLADATIGDAVLVERRYETASSTAVSTTWFRRSNALVPLGNVLGNGTVIVRVPMGPTTAMPERRTVNIHVAPNPAVDHIQVERADRMALGEVRLFDPMGREVRVINTNGSTAMFDLSALPAGTFILHVTSVDGAWVQRLVHQTGH